MKEKTLQEITEQYEQAMRKRAQNQGKKVKTGYKQWSKEEEKKVERMLGHACGFYSEAIELGLDLKEDKKGNIIAVSRFFPEKAVKWATSVAKNGGMDIPGSEE